MFIWHAGGLPGGGDWDLGLAFSCGSNWSIAGKSEGGRESRVLGCRAERKEAKGQTQRTGPIGLQRRDLKRSGGEGGLPRLFVSFTQVL